MLWMFGSTRNNDSDTASVVSMCRAFVFGGGSCDSDTASVVSMRRTLRKRCVQSGYYLRLIKDAFGPPVV